MQDIQVWYHGAGCADGFGAAYAAWLKFADRAQYVPVRYGDRMPTIPEGTLEVYLLDFCFTREEMAGLLDRVSRESIKFVLLDHHKSAREVLTPFATTNGAYLLRLDESKSGAVLAWEFFHPRYDVPELLLYVQDRDLWQWKMPKSRELSTWLRHSLPFSFENWGLARARLADHLEREIVLIEAVAMHRVIESQVESCLKQAHPMMFLGYEVPIANVQMLQSEVGEALCRQFTKAPFSATYYDRIIEGDRVWSLRSASGFDCQALARKIHGGGGHPGAAGFRSSQQNYVSLESGTVVALSE